MRAPAVRWLLTLALALCNLFSAPSSPAQASRITNPFLPAADPFITRSDGRYLLTATFQNRINIWSSPTLDGLASNATTVWLPQDGLTEIWSPTLWHVGQSWWIYFTARYPKARHAIYALQSTTNDPLGTYVYRGEISLGSEAIDPSILSIDGKSFLMYVNVDPEKHWNAVWITALADPMTPSGPKHRLILPDQSWERGAGTPNNYPVAEGPTALYHQGKTFIVYSGSDTGTPVYCLGLMTYRGAGDPTLTQNWIKRGPVFSFSEAHHVFGPGRGAFTTSADGKQNWLVYHAKASSEYTYKGRTLRLQPFGWTKDGFPDFGIPVPEGPLPQ